MTTTADYSHVLELVRRLDRPARARLVAQVVQELAQEPQISAPQVTDPRAVLAEIRAHFAQLGPVSPSNVAVTRARRRLTLVSSFDHTDMDPARTRSRGVELLRL